MIVNDFNSIIKSNIDWQKFSNKTILITGANGFLPAYMVDTLMYLNDTVLYPFKCNIVALVRNEEHSKIRFSQYLSNENFVLLVQDVSEKICFDKKIDYIIHAASPASPKYYNENPVGVILPNILGTKNTLELAIQNNIEGYLYFSSSEVYGELSDGAIITEDTYGSLDPTSIRACYGQSKRMGENLCVSYGHQFNIPVKIVRPFHTYGPGMKLDDGRARRSFCYLADATIAFFIVLLKGKVGQAYNVANPHQTVSIRELADVLVSLFPEKKLTATFTEQDANYLQSQVKGLIPDISKIQSLGWNPTTTIEDGFKKTILSYKNR